MKAFALWYKFTPHVLALVPPLIFFGCVVLLFVATCTPARGGELPAFGISRACTNPQAVYDTAQKTTRPAMKRLWAEFTKDGICSIGHPLFTTTRYHVISQTVWRSDNVDTIIFILAVYTDTGVLLYSWVPKTEWEHAMGEDTEFV